MDLFFASRSRPICRYTLQIVGDATMFGHKSQAGEALE
jgi:hypothetical protein